MGNLKIKICVSLIIIIAVNIVVVKNSETTEHQEPTTDAIRPNVSSYHYCQWEPYRITWSDKNREEKCHAKCVKHKAFLRPDNEQLVCYTRVIDGRMIWGPNANHPSGKANYCECGMRMRNPNVKDPLRVYSVASCENLPYKIRIDENYYKVCRDACEVIKVFQSTREKKYTLAWCYHDANLSAFNNGAILEGVISDRILSRKTRKIHYFYNCWCVVPKGQIKPAFGALSPTRNSSEAVYQPEFHFDRNHRLAVKKLTLLESSYAPSNIAPRYYSSGKHNMSYINASEIELRVAFRSQLQHHKHYPSQKPKISPQTEQQESNQTRNFKSLSIVDDATTSKAIPTDSSKPESGHPIIVQSKIFDQRSSGPVVSDVDINKSNDLQDIYSVRKMGDVTLKYTRQKSSHESHKKRSSAIVKDRPGNEDLERNRTSIKRKLANNNNKLSDRANTASVVTENLKTRKDKQSISDADKSGNIYESSSEHLSPKALQRKRNSIEAGDSSTKHQSDSKKNASNESDSLEKFIDKTEKKTQKSETNYDPKMNVNNSPYRPLTVHKPIAKLGETGSLDIDKLRLFDLNVACSDDPEKLKKINNEKKGSSAFIPFIK